MKYYDYFKNLFIHRLWVLFEITKVCLILFYRGFIHDWAKYTPTEIKGYTAFSTKLRDITYGSPEYTQLRVELDDTLQHHYQRSPHHPEFHGSVDGMNLIDIMEMFCDWKVAVKKHNDGDFDKSLKINKVRFGLSDQLCKILENTK